MRNVFHHLLVILAAVDMLLVGLSILDYSIVRGFDLHINWYYQVSSKKERKTTCEFIIFAGVPLFHLPHNQHGPNRVHLSGRGYRLRAIHRRVQSLRLQSYRKYSINSPKGNQVAHTCGYCYDPHQYPQVLRDLYC